LQGAPCVEPVRARQGWREISAHPGVRRFQRPTRCGLDPREIRRASASRHCQRQAGAAARGLRRRSYRLRYHARAERPRHHRHARLRAVVDRRSGFPTEAVNASRCCCYSTCAVAVELAIDLDLDLHPLVRRCVVDDRPAEGWAPRGMYARVEATEERLPEPGKCRGGWPLLTPGVPPSALGAGFAVRAAPAAHW